MRTHDAEMQAGTGSARTGKATGIRSLSRAGPNVSVTTATRIIPEKELRTGKGNLVLKKRFRRVLMWATIVLAPVAVSGPPTPAYAGGSGCTGSSVESWQIYPYWSNSSAEIEG